MTQIIDIDIDERGNVRFEGKGFVGGECDALMQELEAAVGEIEKKVYKPEFRQARQVGRTAVK